MKNNYSANSEYINFYKQINSRTENFGLQFDSKMGRNTKKTIPKNGTYLSLLSNAGSWMTLKTNFTLSLFFRGELNIKNMAK